MTAKQSLPNSTAVLVLGICSIVFGCFFVGLVLGIIGVSLSGKGRKMYREDAELYDGYGALNAGYIMSLIGIVLGGMYTFYWIFAVALLGGAGLSLLHLLAH